MCIVYRGKEMCAHIFAYAQICTGGVLSVCVHGTQLSILMESGLFPGSQRQFEQRTWDPSITVAMSSNLSAMLLASAKALHTFAPNWPHQWPHGQDGGSRHSERFISNSKKFCHQWLEPIQHCFAISPQSCHFGSHVRSLTWIHIVRILNALFWTSSILARHRNVCLLWHHPAVAAHGPDPLCAKLFRRICPQWDSIPKRKDADMRERFASIDLAQCRIACKTL